MADRFDTLHGKCVEAFRQFRGNLVTTWPVLTEAFYFLDDPYSRQFLVGFHRASWGPSRGPPPDDLLRIRALMTQYALCRWISPMHHWSLRRSALTCAAFSRSTGVTFSFTGLET